MRRCARGRRFPSESRYSLSAPKLSSTRPNSWGRQAAASGPGIQDAPPQARRFYEPQKHGQQFSLTRSPEPSPMLGSTRRENRLRFSRPKNSTAQSTAQFSAPCLPHCGSAFAPPRLPSPAAILAGLAECQPAEYALLGGRATGFSPAPLGGARGRALTPLKLPCAGGGRVTPAGRSDTAYRLTCSAQFLVRAWGNLVKTHKVHFDDFPPKAWRAMV